MVLEKFNPCLKSLKFFCQSLQIIQYKVITYQEKTIPTESIVENELIRQKYSSNKNKMTNKGKLRGMALLKKAVRLKRVSDKLPESVVVLISTRYN